ncbi:MAG TPA: PDZ domain-containing protein, partial [Candidatus Aminicenantes bacterium]|nr:PDZ domain-containing protein [Candidatus Aminicenantes bacterium]
MKNPGVFALPADRTSRLFLGGILLLTLLLMWFLTGTIWRSATQITDENLFAGNTPRIKVIQVTPGGASDRAGMKAGDEIVAINGQRFRDAMEADQIMRRHQ